MSRVIAMLNDNQLEEYKRLKKEKFDKKIKKLNDKKLRFNEKRYYR